MPSCTFFGHRNCPDSLKHSLRAVIIDLITNYGVDMFYVGHHGGFDGLVRGVLCEIAQEYPRVRYAVVQAYMPSERSAFGDAYDTMLPEGIELVHPRYTISWRNNWMLQKSDFVVAYVAHSWGGAAQYVQKAVQSGKTVINLYHSQEGGHAP